MSGFTVEFYETVSGYCPVEEYLSEVDIKMRARLVSLLELLEDKGNQLRKPYSKYLDDGIFELRCKVGSNSSRILYFFYFEGKIVLTNGFSKKTQKTPKNHIKLAKKYRNDYLERMM